MTLNVFISGTTGDFAELRGDLAEQLRRFRNLDIYPVVQEDLTEASTLDGATVDRLITNVRGCALVVCLVGYGAGAPAATDRMTIQQIAEQRLRDNFRKSSSELGSLWHAWADTGHGMTYTQLEFFLAASVFADQSRVRVCLPVWDPITTKPSDREKAVRNGQAAYLDFLRQSRFWLDRVDLREAREATVTLAVEFALQQRDATYGVSLHVAAREALIRSLTVLDNLNMRGRLTNDGFDAFYRAVWPRLDQAIAILDHSSDPISIRGRQGPLLHLASDNLHTLATRATDGAHALCFGADGALQTHVIHAKVSADEQLQSMSPGGELLMTWSTTHGHTIHIARRDPLHWSGERISKHNPYSRRPAIGGSVDHPWCLIWREGACIKYEFTTGSETPTKVRTNEVPTVELVPLISGAIELLGDVESPPIRLPMSIPFTKFDATSLVSFELLTDEPGVEQLRFCEIRRAKVADLFLIAESGPLKGHVHSWYFRRDGRRLVLAVETMVADEQTEPYSMSLDGQTATDRLPILPQDPSVCVAKPNPRISLPGAKDDDPRYPFPHAGRYLWSLDGDYLVHIEDAPPALSRVRVWYFPRPLGQSSAASFLGGLERILNGRREFSEFGEQRAAWQRALQAFA